jgi:tRNA1Val (adenine37-N6)-methyltransferase
MSNSYFRFKQFQVQQDRCAMKVSTDACIQGAWTPVAEHVGRVLDIGCGTGLLSLMLAQRAPQLQIDAIELDNSAAAQAAGNVAASPWSQRIRVMPGDARDFLSEEKYELIICNPPFFHNSLPGKSESRNLARHSLSLGPEDLFAVIRRNLDAGGYACAMWPAPEHVLWEQLLSENNWHIHRRLSVRSRDEREVHRVISLSAAFPAERCVDEYLSVHSAGNEYTPAFVELLQPYYLYL